MKSKRGWVVYDKKTERIVDVSFSEGGCELAIKTIAAYEEDGHSLRSMKGSSAANLEVRRAEIRLVKMKERPRG